MHDEDYIAIERWDDQIGGWMNVEEAVSIEDARTVIKLRVANDMLSGYNYNYSILQVKREVIKA